LPAVALAALVTFAATASAAPPRVWIIGLRDHRDPASHLLLHGLAGRISVARAGERVTIVEKDCGSRGGYHRSGQTRTTADGSWFFGGVGGYLPTMYRARWRRAQSRPFTLRSPLYLSYEAGDSPRTITVRVETTGQNLAGRVVELQRQLTGTTGARWIEVRTARFRRDVLSTRFKATLRLPVGDFAVRVYAPARTAAPCYTPGWSQPFQAPSATSRVTIRSSFGGPNGARQLVLSGRIASGAPGQPILVSIKACGPANREWRPLIGFETGESTRTTAGGAWRWVYPDPRLDEPLYFRAAWGLAYSRALLVRVPLHVRAKVRSGTVRVIAETEFSGQSLAGRTVELQRRIGDRWVRIRAAALQRAGSHTYTASFRIGTRRQTLRAFVPAPAAAPCYLATATARVRP
jgi:hypothetical protein